MRTVRSIVAFVATLLSASLAFAQAPAAGGGGGGGAQMFTLSTTAFPDGGVIPVRFSQAAPGAAPGEGTSPALTWANAPANTRSFVLHMHDMEVVRNRTTEDQLHWLVWNIPATATGLAEGIARGATLPDGSRQTSATGPVYRGPGAGANGPMHHYVFELYALDIPLPTEAADDPFATRTKVFEAMQGHILGKAVYLGLFRRPQ
jgi:Raf kinase inhibitor-like YbhB/YbcL family protein